MYAAVGKESTVEQREIRRPVNSWLRQQESYPGARHGPSMQKCMYYKAREMLKKARKHKNGGYRNILDRWNNDDKHHMSWSDIGWTEERIVQYDEIALEDHSCTATKEERSRNETSWKLSMNAEGIQGPLNQRSDFIEAKQTCKRLHHEYTAITGSGNKPFSPGRQVRQRLDQQFEGLEKTRLST